MRINHKSDFDFRLDLYAADPYGTAVASGFPDCDFTGKLFIGPSARSRQCFIFSKSGSKFVNCFDSDRHLHIIVSGHNLTAGPLFCELTLKIEDNRYPGGYRSVVHTFPLNIYLTETDAEQISPTVSVTLPIMQKVMEKPPTLEDPTEDETPPNRVNSRFAEPWLSPRVCGGTIRTGSYVGNIYRNDKGRIMLSGHKDISRDGRTFQTIYLPQIMNLGIEGLTLENLASSIHHCSAQSFTHSFHDNHITLEYQERNVLPGYYLEIKKTPYVAIAPDSSLKFYNQCPTIDYKPKPVTLNEVRTHAESRVHKGNVKLFLDFGTTFILQKWEREKKVRIYKDGLERFTSWVKPKVRNMRWKTKHMIIERADVRPLFFRVARKKHGVVSEWLYFKALHGGRYSNIRLIQTDETGAAITANFIEL